MIYVVQQGDRLPQLAQRFGVSQARLRSDNGLGSDQPLVPGQALAVLVPTATYTVRPGDTLWGIARQTGVPLRQLLQYNPTLTQGHPLSPGEVLTLALAGEREGHLSVGGYAYPHVLPGVLRQALPFLTTLSVFSYGFQGDGTLVVPEDRALLAEAQRFRVGAMLVLTSMDESGNFSSQRAAQLFQDQALQDRVLDELVAILLEKGYQGLDVDFEYIARGDRAAFLAFLGNARDRLHQVGLSLHVDLAPKTHPDQEGLLYEGHDYGAVGTIADSVLLMTYEWGYAYGLPMAVAPLPQVAQVVRYAVTEIPPGKIQLGIPNYGYDWPLPYVAGQSRARSLSSQQAVALARRYGAAIQYDSQAQAPWFRYTDDQGRQHEVWFEDARSIQAKLALVPQYGLWGVGYWNLMREFPQTGGCSTACTTSGSGKISPAPACSIIVALLILCP